MKKIIAAMATVAMASTMFVSTVSAAAPEVASITSNDDDHASIEMLTYSGSIASTDILVVSVKDLKTGSGINISSADASSSGNTLNVKNLGTAIELTGADGNQTIDMTSTGNFAGDKDYLVTVIVKSSGNSDNSGKIFQGFLYKANQNRVDIKASVEPILSMDLDHHGIDFGQLEVNTLKTMTGMITLSTNAAGGASLFVQSANTGAMVDTANTGNIIAAASGVTVDMSTGTTADNYGYGIRVKSTASGTDIGGYTSYASAGDSNFYDADQKGFGPMAASASTFASQTSGGMNGATVEVEYGVRISPLQPAGQYADTVTYTVTGNF